MHQPGALLPQYHPRFLLRNGIGLPLQVWTNAISILYLFPSSFRTLYTGIGKRGKGSEEKKELLSSEELGAEELGDVSDGK